MLLTRSASTGSEPAPTTSTPQRNRRRLALLVVSMVVVSMLVVGFASAQIRSPAEVAARTAPPTPSVILVPVEQRELATKIVSRGTGHYGSPRALSVTPSSLKEGARVVTRVPRAGTVLGEGAVAVTVSGRPVFVLEGSQPAFRDLGPGISGTDVAQLERALKREGLNPGPLDGTFDSATGRAVSALYSRAGFKPLVASDADLAGLRPLESAFVRGSRATGGVQFPSDELVFVPSAPVRVAKVASALGGRPGGTLLTVTDSVVAVDGALPVEQAGLIQTGARVVVDEPALGIKTEGTVSHVATAPGTNGVDGFHVFFQVNVPKPPPSLVGASVRLTIPVESTRQSGLAVPVSAVSMAPDGSSRIQRDVGGVLEFITVDPGFSADGYVTISAQTASLSAGDMVAVGLLGGTAPAESLTGTSPSGVTGG